MSAGKEKSGVPKELIKFIKTGSKFIIAGHKEPDGDCVGCQLTLRSVLVRLGKKAVVCSEGPFKRAELKNYAAFFSASPTEEEKDGAKVIVVDCSGIERTGSLKELLEELPFAVIDHHAAGTHLQSTEQAPVYVEPDSPSCTLLIYKLIKELDMTLTEEEASLLLFGLCTDSGYFRHLTEKNADVFEAAAGMVKSGASPKNIFNIMNGGKTLSSRILLGHLLSRTESHFDGKLLLSYETLEEFNTFGFEGRDSENLNRLLLSVDEAEAVVIIRQERVDYCTVSLRSVEKIDVAKIAASHGGGGHKNASGLAMEGIISDVKQIMLKSFSAVFQ